MVDFCYTLNSTAVLYFPFFFQLCMYLFEHRIPAYNIQQRKLVGFVFGESAEL